MLSRVSQAARPLRAVARQVRRAPGRRMPLLFSACAKAHPPVHTLSRRLLAQVRLASTAAAEAEIPVRPSARGRGRHPKGGPRCVEGEM